MGKMLIGTDDYGLYQAVSATLESLGLETVWALNGLEVIQEAEAEPADAVFLDSAIGVINLFECCAALRGTPLVDKKLPIFIITSNEIDPRKVEKYALAGVVPREIDAFALRELLSRAGCA